MYQRTFCLVLLCLTCLHFGCRPPVIATVSDCNVGTISARNGYQFTTGYFRERFPSEKQGLIIVARSKGDAETTRKMLKEGIAKVDIDGTIFTYPLTDKELSHDDICAIYFQAQKQHDEMKAKWPR